MHSTIATKRKIKTKWCFNSGLQLRLLQRFCEQNTRHGRTEMDEQLSFSLQSNQSFQEDQVEWKEPKHHLPLKDFLGSSWDLACWAISGWGFLPPNSAILQLSPFVHTQHLHNLALCNCGNLFGHVSPPGDHITMSQVRSHRDHRGPRSCPTGELFTLAWVAFLPFVPVDRLCDWGCVQLYTHCSYCKLGPRAFGIWPLKSVSSALLCPLMSSDRVWVWADTRR